MYEFLSGATAVAALTAAVFFLKFFAKVKDRFFLFFSIAFLLFALERFFLVYNNVANETNSNIYYTRFAGFIIIIAAIIDKNRRSGSSEIKKS